MLEFISKHITYWEATKSKDAQRLGLLNNPNTTQIQAMRLVAEKVFEPVREYLGKPININSFFRRLEVNKAIKGSSKTSQHLKGEAIDLDCEENIKIFNYIKDNLVFDQLIAEFEYNKQPKWIHVSYSNTKNRKEVLISTTKDNKTEYLKYTKELFDKIYS